MSTTESWLAVQVERTLDKAEEDHLADQAVKLACLVAELGPYVEWLQRRHDKAGQRRRDNVGHLSPRLAEVADRAEEISAEGVTMLERMRGQ